MSIRETIRRWLSPERRSGTSHPSQWLIDWVGGGSGTSSGVSVNASTALKYTPFWAAVRIISGTLAALPLKVYQRLDDGGKEPLPGHRLYQLLHERPNEYMDWVSFAETRQAHVLCYGNGYAEIQRDGAGRPVALWPLLPNKTTRKMGPDGVPYYEVTVDVGTTVALADANVLHVKGLGFDGYTGYDVIAYHKETIGYGMAVKEYAARFFGQGATPSGVLEYPGALDDNSRKNLNDSLKTYHEGLTNAHRVMILEEGMKWNAIGVEPAKAQALEAMKFTVDDCSRIFQIPPHKLGSMEFSKYNNVEQLQIDFVTTTMLYWFRKWEQEINHKLLMPSEQGRVFAEILADAALRGNTEARTAYYVAGRQWGFLSINDIRAKENMNPIGPEGDVYLDPLNMAPAGSLTSSAAVEDEPDDDPDGDPDPDDDVRAAHRVLLIGQWQRVCTRVQKGARKGTLNGFWAGERQAARDILIGAANAWAAVTRCQGPHGLDAVLARRLAMGVDPESLDPETLADELMNELGGRHG